MKNFQKKLIILFLVSGIFYTAWATGFRFEFSELKMFPNYNLLTRAFSKGQLHIENTPPADTQLHKGRRYIFSGPVPAVLRLPVMLAFDKGIPTGLMIVIFCAGIGVLFTLSLRELLPPPERNSLSFAGILFTLLFIINGISLHMVTIPSLHHESICTAMFFLSLSILLLLRIKNLNYRISPKMAASLGLSLSLAIGSRFSYIFAAATIGAVLTLGMLRRYKRIPTKEIVRTLMIITGIGTISTGILLWYNYGRFGSFFDFGMPYLITVFKSYFVEGGYFRYDHFHYNFWALFFQTPQVIAEFPFLLLPRYILKVESVGLAPYFLIHTNELVISIFILMPIFIFSVAPLLTEKARPDNGVESYLICAVILTVQILSFIFTVGTIARYYYDILPMMMMMAYLGAAGLLINRKITYPTLIFLASLSSIISWALPLNAIKFYAQYIDFYSPLLKTF